MKQEKIEEQSSVGTIKINNEVIAIVAARTTIETKGVAGMSGGMVDGLAKVLGRKNPEKGIKVVITEDEISIDISILVEYSVSIPDVCLEIQRNVKNKIENTTGKNVKVVDINVHGIHFKSVGEKEKGIEEETK